MNIKALFLLFACTMLVVNHGCYEEVDVPDNGVCEPRLTSIEDILDSLEAVAGDETTFNAFFEASFDELIKRSPEWVTRLGLQDQFETDETLLDDLSTGYREQTFDLLEGILEILHGYDDALLDAQDRVTLSSYEWYVADWFAEKEFMHHYYPLTQRSGPQFGTFGFFKNSHLVTDTQDAEDYVSRLVNVRDKLACLRENIEISRENGYLPPQFMIDYNINALDGIVPGVGHELSMYTSFNTKLQALDIDDSERDRLLAEALEAIETSVIPAYQSLVTQLGEVVSEAPEQAGVGLMPDGDEFYAHTLANHTTTDMTAAEIHELGLSEVSRIRDEMDLYFEQLAYEDGQTLTEYYLLVAEDGGYIQQDDVVSTYDILIADALADMTSAIDLTIVTEVIAVCGDTAGYYIAGSLDTTEPGEFHTPCFDPHPWFPMPTLSYHEAVPGHHLQISIAQETELPAFRVSGATAYVEGWALYAESLAFDLGWYDDDIYGDLGRLQDEMLRAVRLVVDTGLHVEGWTRAEATDYMVENSGFDEDFSAGQMDRYAAWPGQSTAYKIGMMKILELRDDAQLALGDEFDLADFHRAVLLAGSVPMLTLEQVVQNYINGEYKGANPLSTWVSPFDETSPVRFALPRPKLIDLP